jgi:diguanylate cyclase (GGDEF)-like protein/PAS domain S-box-containing protein
MLVLAVALTFRERTALKQLARYRDLFERLPDGVILIDANGVIRQQNTAAARLLGHADDLLVGSRISSWLPFLNEANPQELRQCILVTTDEGQRCPVEITRLLPTSSGDVIVLIHPAKENARWPEDVERYQRSQYFARIGTWDWDVDTENLYWSEAIYSMFGYKVGEITPTYERFCESVHPEDRAKVRAGELRCIQTGENHDEEYRVVWPDGSIHWLRETGNVVKSADNSLVKMMGVVRDITEEKASTSLLHQMAHYDPLTGLPNRLVLEDRLSKALERARSSETRVALVFVDLNDFKEINDQYGHAAGDRMLISAATRLNKILRSSDTVARIGGDEFVVVLEDLIRDKSLQEEAQSLCEKILTVLSPPVAIGNDQCYIGTSLGVAVFPDHASNMDTLIHIADLAMYEAKRSGNNQYRLGRPTSLLSHDTLSEIGSALAGN